MADKARTSDTAYLFSISQSRNRLTGSNTPIEECSSVVVRVLRRRRKSRYSFSFSVMMYNIDDENELEC